MNSSQTVLTVVATAITTAFFTAFAFHSSSNEPVPRTISSKVPIPNDDVDISSLETRMLQLEDQLQQERSARQALEQMLGKTPESEQKLSMATMIETMQQEMMNNDSADEANAETEMAAFREQQRAEMLKRMQPEFKVQELVKAGFNKDEASWIINSETEAQLAQLQARYAARKKSLSDPNSQENLSFNASEKLRSKLGDQYYERYLKAKGRPTSISAGSVMNNSPGANAGLQPGDEIVAYNNKRVFSIYGLNRMTASGKEGENVLIEVERNGESVQLTIPRGPIGVESNQYGRRR